MNGQKTILIVDDEIKILEMIKDYLDICGYKTLCAQNGVLALKMFEENHPNLVLLDLMMPDLSGEEVCKKIRAASKVPIIMLTAKVDEQSIIRGLNIGADDYIAKPFSLRELAARIKAALRRAVSADVKKLIFGKLTIDTDNHFVMLGNSEINLTSNEYKILTILALRPEKIHTRDEIIEKALGDDFDGFDRTVDTHIKNLRQKIGDDYIATVYGMGYRFKNKEIL
ncbi:MAG: response regulator transcription factor [Elusimicrobiota bacterium]|jgi:DNA-binding response OmpR family regulator|nr:response regulator transcription factor [Elusimicrobiota bacterium]